jgi:hypothetical protein
LGREGEYRWWEALYMTHPLKRHRPSWQPFAISLEDISEADIAASNRIGNIQFAAKPCPMDDENIDDFCGRWTDLLAKAYSGQLEHPRYLPLS